MRPSFLKTRSQTKKGKRDVKNTGVQWGESKKEIGKKNSWGESFGSPKLGGGRALADGKEGTQSSQIGIGD